MNMLNYIPRGDRVLVKRLPTPVAKAGDLSLPDSQKKPLNAGTVIKVGPGQRNAVTGYVDVIYDIRPGDVIEFLDYAGSDVEIDGEDYIVLRECEIHGVRPQAKDAAGWGSLGEPVPCQSAD